MYHAPPCCTPVVVVSGNHFVIINPINFDDLKEQQCSKYFVLSQVPLNLAARKQIYDELRSLPDVCESLYNLDVAVSFLKTTGGCKDTNLYTYMAETLKMDKPLNSKKVKIYKLYVPPGLFFY